MVCRLLLRLIVTIYAEIFSGARESSIAVLAQ
jgi:hypothetical protein